MAFTTCYKYWAPPCHDRGAYHAAIHADCQRPLVRNLDIVFAGPAHAIHLVLFEEPLHLIWIIRNPSAQAWRKPAPFCGFKLSAAINPCWRSAARSVTRPLPASVLYHHQDPHAGGLSGRSFLTHCLPSRRKPGKHNAFGSWVD